MVMFAINSSLPCPSAARTGEKPTLDVTAKESPDARAGRLLVLLRNCSGIVRAALHRSIGHERFTLSWSGLTDS